MDSAQRGKLGQLSKILPVYEDKSNDDDNDDNIDDSGDHEDDDNDDDGL